MYYPPYNPYYNPGPYRMIREAKHGLRKTANALCWTLLAAMFLISGFVYLSRQYLAAVGFQGGDRTFQGMTPVLYYLSYAMAYLMGIAVPVLLYFAIRRIPLEEALPFQRAGALKTAACVFFGAAVCMLANIPANVVSNVQKAFGFSGDLPEMPLNDDPRVLVLYVVTIAVIPPIVEELLFRGMILQSLRRYGDGFAVVASAILFGLYHGNFIQMVFAFIAGLAMALVVVRTGSLWTSVLIHLINNGVSVGLQMVQRYAGENVAARVNTLVMGVMLLLGLAAVIWLSVKDKHFFRSDAHDPVLRLSEKLGAVFSNPGGVAVLAVSLISSITVLTQY